ncbi:MAG: hypothetical protein Q8L78_07150 [Coxiellaceae bacterium]|nr:hypothetical protein [Coxiellaceae bacterium]
MRFLRELLTKEKQGQLSKFKPQALGYGFTFTEDKNVTAVNTARDQFNAHVEKMNREAPSLASADILFQDVKKASDLLQKAQAEVQIRKAFEAEKSDLAKDLMEEQPKDIASTVFLGGINIKIDLKKVEHNDFSGVFRDIKGDIESAMLTQVATAAGIDPAVIVLYDTVRTIKNVKSPEDFLMLMAGLAASSGSALVSIAQIIKVSVKGLVYTTVPKEKLESLEKYVEVYQSENAVKMAVIIDWIIDEIAVFSCQGLLPENKEAREQVIARISSVRNYMDDLKKQVLNLNIKLDSATKHERKLLKEKIEAVENRIKALEEKCSKLHCWKNLSRSILSNAIYTIDSGTTSVVEDYVGIDIREWFSDKVRTAAEKFDLKRALDVNPEVAMAARTYTILNEHYGDNKTRNKKRETETFDAIEAEAQFLIALEAQQRRGFEAVKNIASSLKFTFQSHQLHDATLSSNHFLLNSRKLSVAKALLKTFHLPVDQEEWKNKVDFDLFYNALNKQLFGKALVKNNSLLLAGNVREAGRVKVISLVNTLDRLKSTGSTDKDVQHNEKITTVISEMINFYSKMFPSEKIIQDKISGEWIFVPNTISELPGQMIEKNSSAYIQARIQKLLDYEITDFATQKKCIVEIEQYHEDQLKRSGSLLVHLSDDEKKEILLRTKQLALLKRIYRDNPRENLVQKEKGDVSPLGLEVTQKMNGYLSVMRSFERERQEKIARACVHGAKAFSVIGAQSNVLEIISTNLRKKIEIDAKNAENLRESLDSRHIAMEAFVNSGQQFASCRYLNPRAAYLADITPEMLNHLMVTLAEADEKLSEKENVIIKAGAKIDDFFEERDKYHEKSFMSSQNKKMQLDDVRRTREEIAITMYERLLLTQEGHVADLVRHAGLVQSVPCDAYRLSSEQIVAYYDFIHRYGAVETKINVLEHLQPANQLLEKLSVPLENAWVSYQVASSSEDVDIVFSAAKNFATAAYFLVDESDRVSLVNLSEAVVAAEALLHAYEKNVFRSKTVLTGAAEKVYLIEMGFKQHPKEMLDAYKKQYYEKVNAVLSPSKIISTEWGKNISTQQALVVRNLSNLEKINSKKMVQLNLKRNQLKQRLDVYNSASSVGKFVRSITVSFKLGFPPISFSRVDNAEKRENDLYVAESRLVAEQADFLEKKATLELEKKRIQNNAKQIAQHLINTIRLEMKGAKIPSAKLKNIREFVVQHAPELLIELDRETDFVMDFIWGVLEGESVSDLKMPFVLIEKFNKPVSREANIIFDVLNGNVSFLAESESLNALIEQCADTLLANSENAKRNGITVGRIRNAIRSIYVEPLIVSEATKNVVPDCNQLKMLLTLFPRAQQADMLNECITITKNNSSALFNVFNALPAFSEAINYATVRDNLFQNYFESRVVAILEMANQANYDEASYESDLSVLVAAAKAGSDCVSRMLDEAVSSALIMHNDEDSKLTLTWNENIAWLVEAYAKPETICQYRLLRLKELCADAELQKDEEKAQEALSAFVDSMMQACAINNTTFNLDQSFIDELMNSDTPSWIAEAIVLKFGSDHVLQMMHVKWMTSAIARMSSEDYEETDKNEAILHEMIQQRTEKTDLDRLEDFIGKTGVCVVKEGLQKISANVTGARVNAAVLVGDPNDIETISPSAASAIKLANSKFIQWLRTIPAFMQKSTMEFDVDDQHVGDALLENPAVQRAFAAHDLNVLSKAYYHLFQEAVGATSYETLDLEQLNKILLLSPLLREKEKEIWIENRRHELRLEAMERAKLAQACDALSAGKMVSKRILSEEDFAEEMIEYPFERFIREVELHWARNRKNEYNYHENPDIYYSHYLLQVQPIAERLIREKIIDEIAILVEKNKIDSARSKKTLRALSEIDRTMISPISRFSQNHVDPIIDFLKIDQEKKSYLRKEMLALCEKYNDEQAARLMHWSNENKLSIPTLSGFIAACKKGVELRNLMNCAYGYFALEAAFDDAIIADTDNESVIEALLKEVASIKNIPALRECVDLKIDEWITAVSAHLLRDPLEKHALIDTLSIFVNRIGTAAQKEKMAELVITKNAIAQSLKYLQPLDGNQDTCASVDIKTMVAKLLRLDLKKNEALVKTIMPLLLARVKALLSDVGFSEDKDWKEKQLPQHVPSGMSMMAGAGAASMYLNRQESPNRKVLQDILSLIVAYGSMHDRAVIAEYTVDDTAMEKEKLKYFEAMQAVVVKFFPEHKVYKVAVNLSSSVGLFGAPYKDKAEWVKLRDRYAAVAGSSWLSDTGKMFKENRPYLDVVQEMINKVLERTLKKNKGSASFETLKALKHEGYFAKELKAKLEGLDMLDEKFEEFREIVPEVPIIRQ